MFEEISDEVRITVSELSNKRSIQHFFFQNKDIFQQGKYDAQKVLMVGFLLTRHESKAKAGEALWTLVNPEIEDSITRDQVRQFLTELCSLNI